MQIKITQSYTDLISCPNTQLLNQSFIAYKQHNQLNLNILF